MKAKTLISSFILTAIVTGCSSDKQSKGSLPYIDASKNYPEKEIILTDIADVTYVHLNTDNDDYLYRGSIRRVTENTYIVYDNSSGSILFFSKDGNPKSRFNRRGRGPEEYMDATVINYDEITDDVFVGVFFPFADFIQVYSSTGKYKRKIAVPGVSLNKIVNFDEHSLFVFDENFDIKRYHEMIGSPFETEKEYDSPFFLISKTDGKIIDNIKLPPYDIVLIAPDGRTRISTKKLIECPEGVLLCNPETDTVYLYGKDKSLIPVLYKTPPVSHLDPMIILNNCMDVGRYQFIELITATQTRPVQYYFRDKNSGEVFRPKIVLPEYKGKEFNIGPYRSPMNYDYGTRFSLDLLELKQADRENRLSGKLKELVKSLKYDDNEVFMMVRFK